MIFGQNIKKVVISMSVPPELTSLGSFCLLVGIYMVPCLVGSAVSYIVKNKITTKDLKSKKLGNISFRIFISSLLPSVVMSTLDILFLNKVDRRVILATSVLIGAAGDDVTHFLISLKGIMSVVRFLSKGSKSLSDLAELSSNLEEYNKHREEIRHNESNNQNSN